MRFTFLIAAVFLYFCAGLPRVHIQAKEPARAFLDGLRSRGLQDVGLDYLDQMQTSRLAPPEIKASIAYEKSLMLIDLSRSQRDAQVRADQLNKAQSWLSDFIASSASNPKANAARSKLGSLLIERARIKNEDAKKGDQDKLKKESRALYEQAFTVFSELQSQVDQQLSAIPKVLNTRDRKEAKLIERRKQLRADFLQTELFAAAVREELADQLPVGSGDQTKLLAEAALMYEGIYKKYRTRLAGLYARMYQGRCNQRLGKSKDALGFFGELLDQPSEPESMLILKSKTLRLAMESWLSPAENKYVEAIKRGTEWFDESPRGKEREPDWLAIRFSLAKAYKMQADDAKRSQPVPTGLVTRSLQAAAMNAQIVAGESGDMQEPAQDLLTRLGAEVEAVDAPTIDTFDAALKIAKEALDQVAPLAQRAGQLQDQLTAAKGADSSGIEKQLASAQSSLDLTLSTAANHYRLAIELADDSTPQSNVNLARYFLCYTYYVQKDYWRSALVGEFVTRRFPQSPGARQCAKIAMACNLKLLEQNQDDGHAFEIDRLTSLANRLSTVWPDAPDTEDSLASLIPVLINAGEPQAAATFVKKVPEESARRGQLEFMTGQAVWGAYLTAAQTIRGWRQSTVPEEVDLPAEEERQVALKTSAKDLLNAGLTHLPSEPDVSQSNATAMLSLAQANVEDGQYADAIKVLEHPAIGPLTLVQQASDVTSNPVFIEESYRTALRCYVASLGAGGPDMMQKAKTVMGQMKAAMSGDAGKQRMLGVYVSLAQDVQRGMQSATPETRLQMSGVFESFLMELSQGSNELSVLNWVAETFASLGEGLQDGDETNPNAQKYFERSAAAFENILNQSDLPIAMQTQTKARLAGISAKFGDRDKALTLYKDVLRKNPTAINVQVAAARLLQDWAEDEPKRYDEAINGIKSDGPKPLVWGWAKTALVASQNQQFRQAFFQARYELAYCQFQMAQTQSGAAKDKLIAATLKSITKTAGLYPTLGGPQQLQKYDALLKQVQQAAGKPATGLQSLRLNQSDSP